MSNKKRTGYDQTTNLPMSCSVAAAGISIRDGMGAMVGDMRQLLDNVIDPGQPAPLQGLSAEDVEKAFDACWVGEGRLGLTTMASRYRAMSEGEPELALSLKDLDKSTHLFIFGQTSTGMTSAANYRSSKRPNKHTRNKPRR